LSDHHLPRYHVRPPTGYVNDPNGPVFLGNRWHLYFQHVYDTPRRAPVVWGTRVARTSPAGSSLGRLCRRTRKRLTATDAGRATQ